MTERTKQEFMIKFRGVKAHVLSKAVNRITLGINWNGCSKGHIAEAWATADTYTRMDKVSLVQIQQKINDVEAGKF